MKRNLIIFSIFTAIFFLNFNGGINDKINDPLKDSINFENFQMRTPFSTFFSNKELVDKRIFSITQDTLGEYILANRRGVICFNSTEYNFIKTPGMPYKVARDPFTDRIYVACNNSIGYLNTSKSEYQYEEITNEIGRFIGDVNVFFTEDNVTFYYKNYIIILSKNDYSINITKPEPGQFYGGIVQIAGKNYVLIKGQGIVEILDNKLSDEIFYSIKDVTEITFNLEFNNQNVFGTTKNNIFISKDGNFTIIESKKIEYLKNKIISGAEIINENTIAISTLNGGLVFVNIEKQKIVSILNNYMGLPDNEVFTVFKDFSGGLVISNNYGLFRFDFLLPILNYGEYPGLEGNIISSNLLDTTLYVLTTQGVYYLTKAKSDKEFETIIKKTAVKNKKIRQNSTIITDNIQNIPNEIPENTSDNTEEKKQGTLKRWAGKIFGKKDKNKNKQNNDTNNDIEIQDTTANTNVVVPDSQTDSIPNEEPQYIYVVEKKEKKKQFSELYYIYKKIDGINGKCKQAIQFKNQLIVATNSGLFIIKNNKATELLKNEYITKITGSSDKNIFYVASSTTLYELNFSTGKAKFSKIIELSDIEDYVFSIAESKDAIWLGGEGYAYKIDKKNYKNITMYPLSPDFLSVVNVQILNNSILFYIPQGMYKYNSGLDSVMKYNEFSNSDANTVYFINNQDNLFWSRINNSWKYNSSLYTINENQLNLLNLIPSITDIQLDGNNNLWIISDNSTLYKIYDNHKEEIHPNSFFRLNITNIQIGDSIFSSKIINLEFQDNLNLKIELESPFYITNDKVYYQFAMSSDTRNTGWSEKTHQNTFEFPLSNGTYQFYFRSINEFGQESNIESISIVIKPPFWETELFRLGVLAGIILLLSAFIFIRQRALKRRNIKLENTVKLRTLEISKQNEELKTQSEEIAKQNEVVKKQRDEIKNTHEYVTQSINYARRIQTAIFPNNEVLTKHFSEHFIISLPRDIVSGDFFWFKEYNNKLYLTVADCTGHGVPGAFLSMMGIAYLNEVVTHTQNTNAGLILDSLRQNIINSLQEEDDNSIRDGMDMSFVIFDFEKMTIDYAGAYNSIYIYRKEELIELKADKMPIGFSRKNDTPFTNKSFDIKKNDTIYLFTDGYADQFGGNHQRKFLTKNFKKLFGSIVETPLKFQKELLLSAFTEWKGEYDQVDDVTIIGIKI